MLEMDRGLVGVAQAAVRHGELVVDGGRIGGQFQRRGQLLHGAPVVPLCERRAPQLEAHGRLVWMERQRLAESPFGLRRTA